MEDYQVADLVLHTIWHYRGERHLRYRNHDCVVLPRSLRAFQMYEEEPEKADIVIEIKGIEPFEMPANYKKVGNQICYEEGEEMVIGFLTDYEKELPGCSIRMKKDYSYAALIFHRQECQTFDMQRAQYVFEGRLLLEGGFVLHGAAIEWKEKGIIFTGASGAGKSTQAHLWQKLERAIIINGDCPAIRKRKEGTYLYGTPWCGSSGEYMNRETVLSAVVLVKQAKENQVRKLEGQEKFMVVLSQVFRSNVDARMLDISIRNVMACIEDFEVYELYCTKDSKAVEVLRYFMKSL